MIITDAAVQRLEAVVGTARGRGALRRALVRAGGDENLALDLLFTEDEDNGARAGEEPRARVKEEEGRPAEPPLNAPDEDGVAAREERARRPEREPSAPVNADWPVPDIRSEPPMDDVELTQRGGGGPDHDPERDQPAPFATDDVLVVSNHAESKPRIMDPPIEIVEITTPTRPRRPQSFSFLSQETDKKRRRLCPDADETSRSSAWPKAIGTITASAFSTTSGNDVLHGGDQITLKLTNKKQTTTKSYSRFKKARLDQGHDGFVRFCRDGDEIGRLTGDVTRVLAPLLGGGWVVADGIVAECPRKRLSINSSVSLHLNIRLTRDAFPDSSANVRTFADTGDADGIDMIKRKNALSRLLSLMGLFNPDSALLSAAGLSKSPTSIQEGKTEEREISESEAESFYVAKDSVKLQDVDVVEVFGDENGPRGLVSVLREYQRQGVAWMVHKEKLKSRDGRKMHPLWVEREIGDGTVFYINTASGAVSLEFPAASSEMRGGILADEMGLGKTVEVIATILANTEIMGKPKPEGRPCIRGGSLIVCPMSLMQQWLDEIDTHVAPGFMRVSAYYGEGRRRNGLMSLSRDNYDVIVTTYGTLAAELAGPNSPLLSVHWHRVVLDEAHNIKGRTTKTAMAAYELRANIKWAVTGTPIQNQLDDIFSLLHFLQVDPWADYGFWRAKVLRPYESTDMKQKFQAQMLVQTIISPLMLRRTKQTKDANGKPIVELPARKVEVVRLTPSEAERDFYDALYQKTKTRFDVFVRQNKVLSNFAHVLELLLRLRQCCDHPFLVLSAPSKDLHAMVDMGKLAQRFTASNDKAVYVDNIIGEIANGVNDKQECPICLEVMEDAVFTSCAHEACRECMMQLFGTRDTTACHVCRVVIRRSEIVTAPRSSRFAVDVDSNWVESAKITALLENLRDIKQRRSQDPASAGKAVIFSQWTSMLDLVEVALNREKFSFLRLDGTCSAKDRSNTLAEFNKVDPQSVQILLISLKAGGVGLNLTVANFVFMLDQWWNPAVEDQAVDRVHRIGQIRPVEVKRFVIEKSVEERLLKIQEKKRTIAEGALALSSEERKESRLADVKFLFS